MSAVFEPSVEIAFDCLPLRSVGRIDAPLDASEALCHRAEAIRAALSQFGAERTYFLYNGHCVYRFANSEIHGACRFEFEGVVRTDAGDRKCQETLLQVHLASDTCGGVPAAAATWLSKQVQQAVGIEFDRFIQAGQLDRQGAELGQEPGMGSISWLAGLDV